MSPALLVSISGIGMAAVGLLGVVDPARLKTLLADWPAFTRLPTTLVLRIGFGIAFVIGAPHSRLPEVVWLVAAAEFAGVATLLALGSGRLERFVAWWLGQSLAFVRRWCSAALAFGFFLVYAGA